MVNGAMVGAGVWGEVQLRGWQAVDGARIVALCDLDEARLAERSAAFRIDRSFIDLHAMLDEAHVDFLDVCVRPEAQADIVRSAADRGLPVLCQKPFCTSMEEATEVVEYCEARGVPLMVNENFRWQAWYRRAQDILRDRTLGTPFFARIAFRLRTSLPTFQHRQSYFKEMPRWAVFELGVHYLDLYRFLFGEPSSLYARLHRVSPHVKGEDVELLVLGYDGLTCTVEHSWASLPLPGLDWPEYGDWDPWEIAHALQIDGTEGRLALTPDGVISVRSDQGDERWEHPRNTRDRSVAAPLQHFVQCLAASAPFETSGRDYLRTMQLVHAAYRSDAEGAVVPII